MPPAPPSAQGNADHSSGILWGIAAIFVTIGVVWFAFKKYIVIVFLSFKLLQTDLLIFFSDTLRLAPHHFDQLKLTLQYALLNPQSITFQELYTMGTAAGDWLRLPMVLLLFILGMVVYVGNATRVYKKTYDMKELAQLEVVNWPQITPVIGLDLLKEDIDKGPWAMAMTPMQFCKRYQLLQEMRPQRREGMMRKDWDRLEVALKRGEANKIFALQLGPLWKGINALPPYAKALFAIFAARINADSAPALELLRQLSATSTTKFDYTGVKELLEKHASTKAVQKIVNGHAYVLTVMAAMLQGAREDGVQASADFLWLKPLDRRMWYTLNTVGRQTPFVEVAGIYAHWLAEKEAGCKILVPMVEEATNALDGALKDILYKQDEE